MNHNLQNILVEIYNNTISVNPIQIFSFDFVKLTSTRIDLRRHSLQNAIDTLGQLFPLEEHHARNFVNTFKIKFIVSDIDSDGFKRAMDRYRQVDFVPAIHVAKNKMKILENVETIETDAYKLAITYYGSVESQNDHSPAVILIDDEDESMDIDS